MADGVFDRNFGDAISQALLARHQAQQVQRAQAQQSALESMKERAGLLGRLTLSQPGGGPVPAGTYLGALNSGQFPTGVTAEPTPAFAAAGRDTTQRDIAAGKDKAAGDAAGAKNHTELVKNLTKYDTSKWSQQDYATYFGAGQLPAGAKPIEKPGRGGAGKTPEEKQLAALKAEQSQLLNEQKQIGTAINPMGHAWARKGQIDTRLPQLQSQIQALENKLGAAKVGGGNAASGSVPLLDKYGIPGA